MKVVLCLIFLLLTNLFQTPDISKEGMLFNEFSEGTVFFKNGTQTAAKLNYDTFEEQMIFKNNGEVLALADPGKVDYVMIHGRKFVWLQNDIFLEEIDTASIVLYQRYRSQIQSKGKETSYGGVSQSSAVSTVNSLARGYDKQSGDLTKKEEFGFESENLFYTKIGNTYRNISTSKQITKAFKVDRKMVDGFIKKNGIDLVNLGDLVNLIEYCRMVEK